MARYVNIYERKSVVIRKAYDCDFGKWIFENSLMAVIETDDGKIVYEPVPDEDYLNDYTADEYLKECEDEECEVIIDCDCPARDGVIMDNITEWICNTCAVGGDTIVGAICSVVSLLERNGMWKEKYTKSIDVAKIKEELGE